MFPEAQVPGFRPSVLATPPILIAYVTIPSSPGAVLLFISFRGLLIYSIEISGMSTETWFLTLSCMYSSVSRVVWLVYNVSTTCNNCSLFYVMLPCLSYSLTISLLPFVMLMRLIVFILLFCSIVLTMFSSLNFLRSLMIALENSLFILFMSLWLVLSSLFNISLYSILYCLSRLIFSSFRLVGKVML